MRATDVITGLGVVTTLLLMITIIITSEPATSPVE